MQIMEDVPDRSMQARVFGGTCPDCCGDLGVSLVEDGWMLACIHCGATVRSSSYARSPGRLPVGRYRRM